MANLTRKQQFMNALANGTPTPAPLTRKEVIQVNGSVTPLTGDEQAFAGMIANQTKAVVILNVVSEAGENTGKTAITYSGYTKGETDVLKYVIGSYPAQVLAGDDLTAWTTWNGTDEITASTDAIFNLAVCDSTYKAIAAGHATVKSKVG